MANKRTLPSKKAAAAPLAPRRPALPRPAREAAVLLAETRAAAVLPANYAKLLRELKARVRSAQGKAATSVNRQLIQLYLHIGRRLAEQDEASGWGAKIVERLANDLRSAFPAMSGFSRTNLFYMRQIYLAWCSAGKSVQQLVGLVPWGHHVLLLTKVKERGARAWYLKRAVAHGWSRAVLAMQIASRLHERQGKALTNFGTTLPSPEADLARETLKDPYIFSGGACRRWRSSRRSSPAASTTPSRLRPQRGAAGEASSSW